MDFSILIAYIIKELNEHKIGFGKTKLLKLAYLIELDFYRKNRKRLTDKQWIYYKFGPYVFDFDKELDTKALFTIDDLSDEFTKVILNNWVDLPEIDSEISRLITRNVRKYGDWGLNHLLDLIYFNTEPMMKALERFDVLDFSVSDPSKKFKIKELKINQEEHKKLIAELREKIKNAKPI